jgi:hypothetical protein
MSKVTVEVECKDCGGTGLYQGFAEPQDTAVVCLSCGGTGCAKLTYTPFTQRREKRGVSWVMRSRGSFIATGVGPAGGKISYQEFQSGRMP